MSKNKLQPFWICLASRAVIPTSLFSYAVNPSMFSFCQAASKRKLVARDGKQREKEGELTHLLKHLRACAGLNNQNNAVSKQHYSIM